MNVVVLKPSGEIEHVVIKNSLNDFQTLVGGYIEVVSPKALKLPNSFVMVVNEEGRLIGLPINPLASKIYGGTIVGTVVFVRTCGDDFAESTLKWIDHLMQTLTAWKIVLT